MDFGYRARLPNSVVMGISQRQPGAAAAFGAGLQQAGQVAAKVSYDNEQVADRIADSEARIAERELQRRRSEAIAVNSGTLAELDLQLGEEIQTLRNASPEGAPEHGQKAEDLYRKRGQDFLDTLPQDEVVRQFFEPRVSRLVTGGISGEQAYERQRRAAHIGTQTEKAVDRAGALTYANPSFENFAQNRADVLAMIDLQDDLDGTAKAAMKDKATQSQVTALLDGLVDKGGYDAAEEVLATGQFDEFIGGADGRAAYIQRIGTGREVERRATEAEANQARRNALEGLETLGVLIDNGEVPTTSAINAAITTAKAAGVDQSELLEFGFLADRATRTTAAQGLTTGQIEVQRGDLQRRINSGAATAEDRRQFEALDGELGRRDVKDGASIRDLAKNDQGAAAAQLGTMPVSRRWAAAREAGDDRLAVYAALTPQGRSFAVSGRAARKDRPDDFLPPKDSRGQGGGKDGAKAIFSALLGRNIQAQLGGTYGEHFEAALDLMAGAGGTDGWDESAFRRSVQMVMGASHRGNGVWQGGIGQLKHGQRVELPSKWTAAEFDAAYQQQTFADAVYGDGRAANPGDVKRHFSLRYAGQSEQGNTLYLVIGPDAKPLLRKGTSDPFYLPVRPKPGPR